MGNDRYLSDIYLGCKQNEENFKKSDGFRFGGGNGMHVRGDGKRGDPR